MIESKLAKIIIVIAVAAILLGALGLIRGIFTDVADTKCEASVQSYAKLLQFGVPADEKLIDCPADEVVLKGSEEEIKFQLAEEMRLCWKDYGRGKLNLFKDKEEFFCSICSFITTKEDVKVKDFSTYLLETDVRGKDFTYMDYISDFNTKDAERVLGSKYDTEVERVSGYDVDLKKNEDYAVLFIYIKDRDLVDTYLKKAKVIGGTAAAGAGVIGIGVVLYKTAGAVALIPAPGARVLAIGIVAAGAITTIVGVVWTATTGFFDDFEWYSEVLLRPYDENTLQDLGCTFIPVSVVETEGV